MPILPAHGHKAHQTNKVIVTTVHCSAALLVIVAEITYNTYNTRFCVQPAINIETDMSGPIYLCLTQIDRESRGSKYFESISVVETFISSRP